MPLSNQIRIITPEDLLRLDNIYQYKRENASHSSLIGKSAFSCLEGNTKHFRLNNQDQTFRFVLCYQNSYARYNLCLDEEDEFDCDFSSHIEQIQILAMKTRCFQIDESDDNTFIKAGVKIVKNNQEYYRWFIGDARITKKITVGETLCTSPDEIRCSFDIPPIYFNDKRDIEFIFQRLNKFNAFQKVWSEQGLPTVKVTQAVVFLPNPFFFLSQESI